MSFILRYMFFALAGTLLVYYTTPFVVGELTGKDFDPAEPPAQLAANTPTVADTTPPAATNRETPRLRPEPAATAERSTPPAAAPAAVLESPAPENLSLTLIPASADEITFWGVALKSGPLYDKSGKRLERRLPGGALIEQIGAGKSSLGEVAVCHIWHDGAWHGPVLANTADLVRFAGDRTGVDADELEVLRQYCRTNARIEERREELLAAAIQQNPHTEPLRALKKSYDEAAARAKELTAQRDDAIGITRNRIGDELRRLKEEETRMRRELDTLAKQYNNWKADNSAPAVNPDSDPQIREWTRVRDRLLPQLKNFGF